MIRPPSPLVTGAGFLLWEANWLLLRLLHEQQLATVLQGRRVLELGSGTGLAGLCVAAVGAHVLLTDLPSVVEGILEPNIRRNASGSTAATSGAPTAATHVEGAASAGAATAPQHASSGQGEPLPQQHPAAAPAAANGHAASAPPAARSSLQASSVAERLPWAGSRAVGHGSAAAMALDWTEPLEKQVVQPPRTVTKDAPGNGTQHSGVGGGSSCCSSSGSDPRDADVILALDTIWLKDIFACFVAVVMQVLHHRGPGNCAAYLAFVERASGQSATFVRKEAVAAEFEAQGCAVEVLTSEDVAVDGEMRPARVLRITWPGHG